MLHVHSILVTLLSKCRGIGLSPSQRDVHVWTLIMVTPHIFVYSRHHILRSIHQSVTITDRINPWSPIHINWNYTVDVQLEPLRVWFWSVNYYFDWDSMNLSPWHARLKAFLCIAGLDDNLLKHFYRQYYYDFTP